MERIIGTEDSGDRNVLIVLIGAIHGNELAGIKAINNIFKEIEDHDLRIKGKIVGIAGNLAAIKAKKRFLKYDLNRCWTFDQINSIINKDKSELEHEDLELFDIHGLLETLSTEEFQLKILVDLHTTSADNGNFLVLPEKKLDLSLIQSLKLPMVLDLIRYVSGTLLDYMNHKDFISFAFEGGQIGSEQAIDLLTHGVWELMYQSGMVKPLHDFKELLHYEELIGSLHKPLPSKVTVLHRHKISKGDYFRMKPGFENFHKIQQGEILAEDKNGLIKSPIDGLIFMPLYQNIGNDGFFVVKEIA